MDVAVSPTADRLAWRTVQRSAFASLPPLFRRLSYYGDTHTLWVSRIDGGGMRRIGSETEVGYEMQPFGHLRWLPGGKSLSYVYGGELYMIPAA